MKTVIRITNDYQNDLSYQEWKEDISYYVNECFRVEVLTGNSRYFNTPEQVKNYTTDREEFKNTTTLTARGYSQGDWQEYTIYHNEDENREEFKQFVQLLERSFTHQNDYLVQKFERTEINGKNFDADPHDFTSISVRHVEFPEEEDVLEAYNDQYGQDYDEVIIEID